MASGCLPQLDVVGYLVACHIAAFWRVSGCLHRAGQGVWVPRVVRGEGIGNLGTVLTDCGLTFDIKCPLSANQLRLPKSFCAFASYRGASVTAGSEVPVVGRASVVGGGFGFGVVAAHFGSGGRRSSCPDSRCGEGGGYGKTPRDVHL